MFIHPDPLDYRQHLEYEFRTLLTGCGLSCKLLIIFFYPILIVSILIVEQSSSLASAFGNLPGRPYYDDDHPYVGRH